MSNKNELCNSINIQDYEWTNIQDESKDLGEIKKHIEVKILEINKNSSEIEKKITETLNKSIDNEKHILNIINKNSDIEQNISSVITKINPVDFESMNNKIEFIVTNQNKLSSEIKILNDTVYDIHSKLNSSLTDLTLIVNKLVVDNKPTTDNKLILDSKNYNDEKKSLLDEKIQNIINNIIDKKNINPKYHGSSNNNLFCITTNDNLVLPNMQNYIASNLNYNVNNICDNSTIVTTSKEFIIYKCNGHCGINLYQKINSEFNKLCSLHL